MIGDLSSLFAAPVTEEFEESVRVDRAVEDHRRSSINSYHVTEQSATFLREFFARQLGEASDRRQGRNYWLYGYFGSGKSHLLTVLDGLSDTSVVERDTEGIWSALTDAESYPELREYWCRTHDEYHLIPISINLLKYQGQQTLSFSEVVLRAAHKSPALTGVDGGLSGRLQTAYFEDWYRTTDAWSDRTEQARRVLKQVGVDNAEAYKWADVQRYGALANLVLPQLFESVTGDNDGLADLVPSYLDPATAVERLDELRAARAAALGTEVKLVLLLDEVSLFIADQPDSRLTELQLLAENVNQIGQGNIDLVVTAQASLDDEQPRFAPQQTDLGILKDRFQHRHGLPTRHIGEIVFERLLRKVEGRRTDIDDIIKRTSLDPADSFVYNELEQNTDPPLDQLGRDELIDYYPFLPYQAALFVEILSNLRDEAPDPSKSIFSGTARAGLALIHGLLETWLENDTPERLVSLVDFYDLIEPELRDIAGVDVEVVREIAVEVEDGTLEPFDLRVAKAVLLLQYVDEYIPLDDRKNIAVAVMDSLDGATQLQMANRVDTALDDRLKKYIRPSHDETEPALRFTTPIERRIYEATERNEANVDWEAVRRSLDDHLWADVVRELGLPESVPYKGSDVEYPVGYEFSIAGRELEDQSMADGVLTVPIDIRGLLPLNADDVSGETLTWSVSTDSNLHDRLTRWWALHDAVGNQRLPETVRQELDDRRASTRSGLISTLNSGTYEIKDQSELTNLRPAVQSAVDVRYPDEFHPVMREIDAGYLTELTDLPAGAELPDWARRLEVATEDPSTHGGTIQTNLHAMAGRAVARNDGTARLRAVLDAIIEREPIYEGAEPALCAVIWGLVRKGDFVPQNESGRSLDADSVLDQDALNETYLRFGPQEDVHSQLVEAGFCETTDTIEVGIRNLEQANRLVEGDVETLYDDVGLILEDDVRTAAVEELFQTFQTALETQQQEAVARIEAIAKTGTDWETQIEETVGARDWLSEAADIWDRRQEFLLRLDAALLIAEQEFAWLTERCTETASELTDVLTDYGGSWWARDGWSQLYDQITEGQSLVDAIERAWNNLTDNADVTRLTEETTENPWLTGSHSDIVQPAFEQEYLEPLKAFQMWYRGLYTAVRTVCMEQGSAEVTAIRRATKTIERTAPLSTTTGHDISGLVDRLEVIRSVLDAYRPSEVDTIGIVPDDRTGLDEVAESLAEHHRFGISYTDYGVVVE